MTPPPIRSGKRRLLVAEDDDLLQDLYRQLLDMLGFEAVIAGTAEEGIELLKKESFDGVIADIVLPRVGPVPFHEWVAGNRPDLLDRLILASGSFELPEVRAFIKARRAKTLLKPFGLADLSAVLKTVFGEPAK